MFTRLSQHTKGVLALIALTFVWSLMALLPRYLATSFKLFQQIYLRFAFALVLMAILFFRELPSFRESLGSGIILISAYLMNKLEIK